MLFRVTVICIMYVCISFTTFPIVTFLYLISPLYKGPWMNNCISNLFNICAPVHKKEKEMLSLSLTINNTSAEVKGLFPIFKPKPKPKPQKKKKQKLSYIIMLRKKELKPKKHSVIIKGNYLQPEENTPTFLESVISYFSSI